MNRSRPLPPPRTDALDRAVLCAYLDDTWRLSDRLFDALVDAERDRLRPAPLRNPLIFYYGHTASFYVNKLAAADLFDGPQHARLDRLFATGVDPHRSNELDTTAD